MRRNHLTLIGALALCREGIHAFTLPSSHATSRFTAESPIISQRYERETSTYEVDTDEDSEQRIADSNSLKNGASNGEDKCRFEDLLSDVGLDEQLPSIKKLPTKRPVSVDDVFCNRELKLDAVRAIGFDMDYTLAQYYQPAFDKLAFDGAKEKLVKTMGYPKELLDVEYDHNFWVRGLIIDTQRGNFLKIDRHKYVRVAYHGYSPISSETRKFLYSRDFNKVPSFTEKHFVNMDTLFQFVDASLFATLIDMKDNGEYDVLDLKTYAEIYKEVRECVDLCHRDGVIKDEVARDPSKYIVLDDEMVPMLKQFKEAGIKTFLLTNSHWEYTAVAMNYLYHQKLVEGELFKKNEWTELFDTIIVGSCKPAFLIDAYLGLFRVDPETGSLKNTDGIFEIEALGKNGAQKFLDQGKIFQGGNWNHLTAMLESGAGEEILYVGDHLYSDVLRSKRTLGWRSAFIMPELAEEMETFHEQLPLRQKINKLRSIRDELSMYGASVRRNADDVNHEEVQKELAQIEADDEKIKNTLSVLAQEFHVAFHPVWGMMFQAGYQDSRLAYFVQNYACLYTAKASNLGLASASRNFRTVGELLPHDKLLAADSSTFSKGS